MFTDVIAGLGEALSPDVLLWIAVGAVIGSIVAAVPGLGGPFAVALVFPVAIGLDPLPAVALALTATAVSGTANTITGVMFNVPGSGSGVAVMFDGYPMARRGEADRAISAGLMASLFGGVVGALFLALTLPLMLLVVRSFGPAEFVALMIIAMLMISSIQEGSMTKSLIAASVGGVLALVGQAPGTAELRFTFGSLYLWDGIPLVPMVIGLYAVSEMLHIAGRGGSIAEKQPDTNDVRGRRQRRSGILRGARDVKDNWQVAVSSSVAGVLVGVLPGLGGGAAQFAGYGIAAKTGSDRHNYGKGSVQGVIAADTTNNASDGGALIPTLALGIPGSASMAMVLALMASEGYAPGRQLIEQHGDLVWMIIGALVIGNAFAVAISLVLVRFIAGLTFAPVAYIVPVILSVALWGAFTTTRAAGDVLVALAFGLVGLLCKKWGYSRASLVIAFVLAPLLERHLNLATTLYGSDFFFRPIVVGLFLVVIAGIVISRIVSRRRLRSPTITL